MTRSDKGGGRKLMPVMLRKMKKMLDRKPFLTAEEIRSSVPSADALSRKYTSWLILKKHNFPSRVSGSTNQRVSEVSIWSRKKFEIKNIQTI